MRTLALVFAAVMLSAVAPVYAQEPPSQPLKDGNGLLEYCSHVVNLMDSPSFEAWADDTMFAGNMMKYGWCGGYLRATHDLIIDWQVNQALLILAGLRLSGPEKLQKALIERFNVWIPAGVDIGQMARVLVKWLRDHPERLHERPSVLTIDALKDAFPCRAEAMTKKPVTK